MSQLPFPFGGAAFNPTPHTAVHNGMPSSNTAVPSNIPQAQQAAFMQNSQLPGIDMATALQGITPEQLAIIGQLYQSGRIPLPTAPNFPATQTPVTNAQPATNEDVATYSTERQGENVNQEQCDFLRPPPTGPRKRSGSVHMRPGSDGVDKRSRRQQSPPQQPQGYDRRRPEPRTGDHMQTSSPARSQLRHLKVKHDTAKDFILTMHRAGYEFHDVAREIKDARMLRVLYKELGLNAPPEKPQSSQTHSTPAFAQARGQNLALSAAPTPTQNSPPSVAAPKPALAAATKPSAPEKAPAPVSADRSAYLAKLQAAKNKKNESSVAASKKFSHTTLPATQTSEIQQPAATTGVSAVGQLTAHTPLVKSPAAPLPKKATVQTELIRKKLEALKAEQARRQEVERLVNAAAISAINPVPATPSVTQSAAVTPVESANGNSRVATPAPAQETQVVAPTQSAAASFHVTSQFPGLPGLFMAGTPIQPSAPASKSAAPDAPADAVRTASSSDSGHITSAEVSPPVEADSPTYESSLPTRVTAVSSGRATPRHPFNQTRYDSNDDSVIINVSDDEGDESELDDVENEDNEVDGVTPPQTTKIVAPAAKPGPLRNLPAPATFINTSAPATPGTTTPGGSAYERKMQEINEMHRRIAEMQKAKVKPSSPVVQPQAYAAPLPANIPTNALPTLPGLTKAVDNLSVDTTVISQVAEQQLAESSQKAEAKLAQLEEEAEAISEQTHLTSQGTQAAAPALEQTNATSASMADLTTPSDDHSDDDDAMDLSSGEELDSDGQADVADAVAPEMSADEGSYDEPIPTGICANDLAMMSDSSSDSDDSSTDSEDQSDDEYEPAPAEAAAETVSSTTTLQASPQDVDLAPELQPVAREQMLGVAAPEATRKSYYTPYESPLRIFKDYRYHPKFDSDVQGGFKSLTYSNKLDPTEIMCSDELSTGTCQDPACLYQHFSNTAVNDAELLKDLGTRNAPWKTEEEKARWNSGLAEVVRELRNSNQGTDVNAIATRIAQYRREFIGIPDQTLILDPSAYQTQA